MIKIYKEKTEFLKKYEAYFRENEVTCSLMWGICKKFDHLDLMIESRNDHDFILGVRAGKNLILVANTLDESLFKALVNFMEEIDYPGLIGRKDHCLLYHKLYKRLTGKEMIVTMDQRIYTCHQTHPVSLSRGHVRLASHKDIEKLSQWAYDFSKEIGEDTDIDQAKNGVQYLIDHKNLYVLDIDNQIVSMTGRTRALYLTESIGYVYTPPGKRGNGYASKVVQIVTQDIINDGKTAVLYTDLSNPTSNHIYMDIGYKPHMDSIMMHKIYE